VLVADLSALLPPLDFILVLADTFETVVTVDVLVFAFVDVDVDVFFLFEELEELLTFAAAS
jgi:hypothetical protein